jgi:hypothetical protein
MCIRPASRLYTTAQPLRWLRQRQFFLEIGRHQRYAATVYAHPHDTVELLFLTGFIGDAQCLAVGVPTGVQVFSCSGAATSPAKPVIRLRKDEYISISFAVQVTLL